MARTGMISPPLETTGKSEQRKCRLYDEGPPRQSLPRQSRLNLQKARTAVRAHVLIVEKIRIADDERRGHSPDRQRKDGRPEPGETAPKLPERSAESKGQQSRRRTHRSEQKQSPDNPIPHEGIACEDNVQYGRAPQRNPEESVRPSPVPRSRTLKTSPPAQRAKQASPGPSAKRLEGEHDARQRGIQHSAESGAHSRWRQHRAETRGNTIAQKAACRRAHLERRRLLAHRPSAQHVSAVPTMIAGASSGGTERPSRTASMTRAVLQEKSRPTARYAP